MQKRSLLTLFLTSTVSALVIVIVIMGTFNIAILVEDIEEADVLFELNNEIFEEELQIIYDDLARVPDNKHTSFYSKVEETLNISIDYLMNHTQIFANSELSSVIELKHALDIIPEHFHRGFFIIDKEGDVVLDETGYLNGNLLDLRDDSGERLFDSSTRMQALDNGHFSSTWLKDRQYAIYYSSIKKLNNNYYIGLMTSKEDAINIYKDMYIKNLKNISTFDSSDYIIYSLDGDKIIGPFELSESTIFTYIEDRNIGKLTHVEHENFGILHYQVFPELNWLVIHHDHQLNQLRLLTSLEGDLRIKQLIWMFHLMLSLIVIIFIAFYFISKKIRKKLNTQLETLNMSSVTHELISDDKILYDEFKRVVQVFNKINKKPTSVPPLVEVDKRPDFNREYLINAIKIQLLDKHIEDERVDFELKSLLVSILEMMQLDKANLKVDIICDDLIQMTQNASYLKGLIVFFITNLILNSDKDQKSLVTIEIYADDSVVNLSIARSLTHNHDNDDFMYSILDKIEDQIVSAMKGQLDYSGFNQPDRKLSLQCPLVK